MMPVNSGSMEEFGITIIMQDVFFFGFFVEDLIYVEKLFHPKLEGSFKVMLSGVVGMY